MRRFSTLIFAVTVLLAGCQAGKTTYAPGSLTPGAIQPSETIAKPPTITPTPIPVPSATIPSNTPIPPGEEYVVSARRADVWDAPENEKKYWSLQTQLILGEKVLVVDRRGDFSKIAAVEEPSTKDPRGYPGWVRSENLLPGWPAAGEFAIVMTRNAPLRSDPGGTLQMGLYLDTRLPVVAEQKEWIQVRLPDGTTGWIRSTDVRLTGNPSALVPADGLFALAQTMIGVPYWWGGTTADAFDCSGFLYRLFHVYGMNLGRDSGDQALAGTPIERNDLKKGDLIFTSKTEGGPIYHVAMYWGNNTVLDADTPRGVAIRTMSERLRFEFWVTARRYLP
jgi:gamma-D-glutamyl-L-lysine dipeptidyl-peptidase